MAEPLRVNFDPSESQEDFIRSSVLENCFMGPRGEGKALYHADIITDSGIVKSDKIRVGMNVFSMDGTKTKVIGVYPQPSQQLWKIMFSDGASVTASEDHLWPVETAWDREGGAEADTRYRPGIGVTDRKCSQKFPRKRRGCKIVKTSDIVGAIKSEKWKCGGRWSIPLTAPVQFDNQDVPLDAYVLGVLLGDGCLRLKGSVSFCSADSEIIRSIVDRIPNGMGVYPHSSKYDYRIVGKQNSIRTILLNINLLGCRSWEKFVPKVYLWNDVDTRLAVLQGLLDTDGTILKHSNSVSYSTTSLQLAKDVIFLVQSLGGIALQRTRQTNYTYRGEKKNGRLSYHISVRLPNGMQPFRLSRKAEIVADKGERNRPKRYITGVKNAGEDKCVCFKVDHPSGLFLLHDFIPTHNTDAGIMAMTYHASLQEKKYRPIPWAVVRDTWKNLERTTYRSFMYPTCPTSLAYQLRGRIKERDGGRQLSLVDGKGNPIWVAFLFGMDTPDDLNQLLSMQLGGLWVEEAAPAMQEDIGKGISEEVWTLGITSLRHTLMTESAVQFLKAWEGKLNQMTPNDTKQGLLTGALARTPYGDFVPRNRRAQITMNYPSEDHWTWVRFYEEGGTDRALFRIPRGENEHIDDQYRQNMLKSLGGRQDLLDRLVIGRPAHVQLGVAVTPEYHDQLNGGPWHRSDRQLDPMPNLPVFRFWDGDLHPACVFAQITPRGKFMVTDTLRGIETGMGMKQFLDQYVKPLMVNRYSKCRMWRDLGDPTLNDRDPSDSSKTAAQMIERELNTQYEGGVLRWGPRKEALKELLTRTLSDGEPMFVVSKHEKLLHRALSGGWHYTKTSTGRVSEEPNNNDPNCVDTNTECLTLFNGWKQYDELEVQELIVGYDIELNELRPALVKKVHSYEGKFPVINYQNNSLDMVLTSNHRTVAIKRTTWPNHHWKEPFFIESDRLKPHFYLIRMAPSSIEISPIYSDDFVSLCSWFLSEGTVEGSAIRIYQSEKNILYSKEIDRLSQIYGGRRYNNNIHETGWRFSGAIATQIQKLFPNKIVTIDFIHNLTVNQRKLFLYEFIRGDGEWNRKENGDIIRYNPENFFQGRKDTPRITQKSKESIELLEIMAILSGIRPTINVLNNDVKQWRLSLHKNGYHTYVDDLKKEPLVVNGVWCPETTTHTWVAKRNGQIFITGNSHPASGLSHGIAKIFKYERENNVKLPASRKRIAVASSVQPLYQRR